MGILGEDPNCQIMVVLSISNQFMKVDAQIKPTFQVGLSSDNWSDKNDL